MYNLLESTTRTTVYEYRYCEGNPQRSSDNPGRVQKAAWNFWRRKGEFQREQGSADLEPIPNIADLAGVDSQIITTKEAIKKLDESRANDRYWPYGLLTLVFSLHISQQVQMSSRAKLAKWCTNWNENRRFYRQWWYMNYTRPNVKQWERTLLRHEPI